MQTSIFYQNHLDRVSRSFALCISRLEEPLRSRVGLAYLLCRVVDTIEDHSWSSASEQTAAFLKFDRWINLDARVKPEPTEADQWFKTFPATLSEGEQLLIRDTHILLDNYYQLPAEVREVFCSSLNNMSRGMQHFCSLRREKGRLKSLSELNQYCFFVAGVVGELLTQLIHGQHKASQQLLGDAFHFGIFLQKINILKDQVKDEAEGRYLVPARDEVLKSLGTHLRRAMRYIINIPDTQIGYRMFCGVSVGLGAASLPYIEESYRRKELIKISRAETSKILQLIEGAVQLLPKEFERKLKDLVEIFWPAVAQQLVGTQQQNGMEAVAPAPELLRLYHGELGEEELSLLHVG